MNTSKTLLSPDSARQRMLDAVSAVSETETLPLSNARGRITASPIISPINVPPFTNAAMDGYALRISDSSGTQALPIAGKALAGMPFTGSWPVGSCIRIMTGAPIPAGADAVIMQEETQLCDAGISLRETVKPGQNIRCAGEDIRKGDCVVPAGVKLDTAALALLASLGIGTVEVKRKLRVALFSSGDELQPVGQPLAEGQIYDTNRFALRLMLEHMQCEVLDLGIIADDPHALRETFIRADRAADVIISSGGVSVGDADYTTSVLEKTGEITFWKLAIKPGKPFAFGRLTHGWFCGLPGNPVSATVVFYQLVQPLLAKLSGLHSSPLPPRFQVRAAGAFKKTPGRLEFQRGILRTGPDGQPEVISTGHQGSHIFSSFQQGNCFVVLEQERGHVSVGEWVNVEPFNALLKG